VAQGLEKHRVQPQVRYKPIGTAARRSTLFHRLFERGHTMGTLTTRSHLFDDLLRELTSGYAAVRPLHGDPLPSPGKISMDVKESDKDYTVHAEIPGVNKEDIKVSVQGGAVTISAEVRQVDKQTQDERTLREERYYGTVSRSFQLANDVDADGARARYENGVLTLTLPKRQANGHRQLRID
jgi:HSP20 family protein